MGNLYDTAAEAQEAAGNLGQKTKVISDDDLSYLRCKREFRS